MRGLNDFLIFYTVYLCMFTRVLCMGSSELIGSPMSYQSGESPDTIDKILQNSQSVEYMVKFDKQFDKKLALSELIGGSHTLFPEGCMNKLYHAEGLSFPFENLIDENEPEISRRSNWRDKWKEKITSLTDEDFYQWISSTVDRMQRRSGIVFKNSDPSDVEAYEFLLLALWGLFERPSYEVLDYFVKNTTSVVGYEFKPNVRTHFSSGQRKYNTDNLFYKRWLYSVYILGEMGIPERIPLIRDRIKDMLRSAYGASCSIFSPIMLISMAQTFLMALKERSPNGYQSSWNQIRKYWKLGGEYESYLSVSNHFAKLWKQFSVSMEESSEGFINSPTLEGNFNEGFGEARASRGEIDWALLSELMFMIHHDQSMTLSIFLENMFFNLDIDPSKNAMNPFNHIYKSANSAGRTRFWKQLTSFALIMLEVGSEELSSLIRNNPDAKVLIKKMIRRRSFRKCSDSTCLMEILKAEQETEIYARPLDPIYKTTFQSRFPSLKGIFYEERNYFS